MVRATSLTSTDFNFRCWYSTHIDTRSAHVPYPLVLILQCDGCCFLDFVVDAFCVFVFLFEDSGVPHESAGVFAATQHLHEAKIKIKRDERKIKTKIGMACGYVTTFPSRLTRTAKMERNVIIITCKNSLLFRLLLFLSTQRFFALYFWTGKKIQMAWRQLLAILPFDLNNLTENNYVYRFISMATFLRSLVQLQIFAIIAIQSSSSLHSEGEPIMIRPFHSFAVVCLA